MLPASRHHARVVPADRESPRDRLARAFAAECAAAALEVFERHRRRAPRPGAAPLAARRARGEGDSFAPEMFLLLLVASLPSERGEGVASPWVGPVCRVWRRPE